MPVFISYSHKDKEFVDKLCGNLLARKVHIWIDRWEMKPGDSLISSVQAALEKAGAVLVALSPAYIGSPWCKKELNAGLIKELEQSGNTIIPVLLSDCAIPIFLREKFYADFRHGFDESFRLLMEALAKHTTLSQARLDMPEYKVDWSLDVADTPEGLIQLRFNILEHAPDRPFSLFSVIYATLNRAATRRYSQLRDKGFEWFTRACFTKLILEGLARFDLRIALDDANPVVRTFAVGDKAKGITVDVRIETRWLGEDTGKTVILNLSDQILQLEDQLLQKGRKLTAAETESLADLIADFV